MIFDRSRRAGSDPALQPVFEDDGKAIVDIERHRIINFGVDHTAIEFGADLICLAVHGQCISARFVAVKVDGCHALGITAIVELHILIKLQMTSL